MINPSNAIFPAISFLATYLIDPNTRLVADGDDDNMSVAEDGFEREADQEFS
jgi:hypothetical protein